MDKIIITNLEVYAHHGVFPEENALGQKFVVSAELFVDTRAAGQSDALEDSVDYGAVCHLIDRTMRQSTFKLIERVAEVVVQAIFAEHEAVQRIRLKVEKPWAPIGLPVGSAAVEIERDRA